ncbi:MAG: hypothetical protein ACREAY_01270 [Nitrososphaera sp.]|uniref:hypothetical protein n=1 Tax=Nitrososphaera sp. TaxID=1971748 RepID=UPI003D6F3047
MSSPGNPYPPGTPDYYKYQLSQSRTSDREQQLEDQARQKVGYEAYQAATKEAQQKAAQTGQQQTINTQTVEAKKQEILDQKYLVGVTPGQSVIGPDGSGYEVPEQRNYAIPMRSTGRASRT